MCVCVQGAIKIVNCTSAEIHVKDQETQATAMCLGKQVNFRMLLKLRVASGSIKHPRGYNNMLRFYSHGGVRYVVSSLRAPILVDVTCHGFSCGEDAVWRSVAKPPKTCWQFE